MQAQRPSSLHVARVIVNEDRFFGRNVQSLQRQLKDGQGRLGDALVAGADDYVE